MTLKYISSIFSVLLVIILLAGCIPGGMAFTPEQAALRAVIDRPGNRATIDQNTVRVRQSVSLDRNTFVVVTYNQVEGDRKDKCLSVYQTGRNSIGVWQPFNGAGGCSGTTIGQPEPPPMPLEIGGGRSAGSDPGNPGYSHTAGMVNQADITKVRVTWNDGSQQEASVINSTYLALRAGSLSFQKVEGLNADGEVVYTNEPQVAPGK